MQKTSIHLVAEETWESPGQRFRQRSKGISLQLGREPKSLDLSKRHPFDLELCTVPPGASACPYHEHSAQWEMYLFNSGHGIVRAPDGRHPVEPGDVVLFPPGEAHEIINTSEVDLVFYIIADNPIGESCYYPDSDKWMVRKPGQSEVIKGTAVDYLLGEDPPVAGQGSTA